jgi:Formate/nitrite transporter
MSQSSSVSAHGSFGGFAFQGFYYIKPFEVAKNMLDVAAAKAALPASDLLVRGFLSGAILGFATSLAFTATKQTSVPIVGTLIFPVGVDVGAPAAARGPHPGKTEFRTRTPKQSSRT